MTETYNVSGVPVDYQDRMAKQMIGEIKPLQVLKVCDLPKEEEAKADTIYIMQQAWMVIDGKWVKIS